MKKVLFYEIDVLLVDQTSKLTEGPKRGGDYGPYVQVRLVSIYMCELGTGKVGLALVLKTKESICSCASTLLVKLTSLLFPNTATTTIIYKC